MQKEVLWGYKVNTDHFRIKCLKLLLDDKQTLPHYVDRNVMIKELEKNGRTVADATADYLFQVYKYAMLQLEQRFGKSFVDTTPIEFILTVPAVWSDKAKNATLLAAECAGMGDNLRLISEPEAAAVYTMKAIQPNVLRGGDNFVICDAGGGTVDLISYKVVSLAPLVITEAHVGTGGLCGATFLNSRFEGHVRDRLGKEQFDAVQEENEMGWQTALTRFEELVKRNFSSDTESPFKIPFPNVADNKKAGIFRGYLTLTALQAKNIFEPIIVEVLGLIQDQVTKIQSKDGAVSAILLVGGFGQSNYLHSRVQNQFGPNSLAATYQNRSIEVMRPINSWTAVVRGAVLRGLEDTIVKDRRSRYHYGTNCNPVFVKGKHPLDAKYLDKVDNVFRACNAMNWYVKKNDMVSEKRPVSVTFTQKVDMDEWMSDDPIDADVDFFSCQDDIAPSIFSDDFPKVCTLPLDLRTVPSKLWHVSKNGRGVKYMALEYKVDMLIDSASMSFRLKVGGKIYGSVKACFND